MDAQIAADYCLVDDIKFACKQKLNPAIAWWVNREPLGIVIVLSYPTHFSPTAHLLRMNCLGIKKDAQPQTIV